MIPYYKTKTCELLSGFRYHVIKLCLSMDPETGYVLADDPIDALMWVQKMRTYLGLIFPFEENDQAATEATVCSETPENRAAIHYSYHLWIVDWHLYESEMLLCRRIEQERQNH